MARMMRGAALAALGASIALVVAGCSSSGNSSDNSTADASNPVSMTLWTQRHDRTGCAVLQDTVKDFETANPNVTIKIQIDPERGPRRQARRPRSTPATRRTSSCSAAAARWPRWSTRTSSWTSPTRSPPTPRRRRRGLDQGRADRRQDLRDAGLGPARAASCTARTCYKAAGITAPPTTLDELNAAVTASSRPQGVAPIALGAKDAWPAAHWYYCFALRACSEDTLDRHRQDAEVRRPLLDQGGRGPRRPSPTTKPFNDGFLTTSAQQGAGQLGRPASPTTRPAMELMGAWDPGVIGSPDAGREAAAGPRLLPVLVGPRRPG